MKLKIRIVIWFGMMWLVCVCLMGFVVKVISCFFVNFLKKLVKIINGKNIMSMLLLGCCFGDINLNYLFEEEYGENKDDDMILLYLMCLEEDEVSDGKMVVCVCGKSGYYVEMFVKGESCVRNMCCVNINVDLFERVVVWNLVL